MHLTTEQRLQKNTLALMTHPVYRGMAGVFMMGVTSVSDEDPTASTDGFNVRYGREFVATLDDPQLRFLILHENMHKALRHLTTWRWMYDEDPLTANMACDYVINLMLVDSDTAQFIRMPPNGCYDPKYRGMDAAQVYRLLRQEGGGGGGKGFDSHDWEAAKAMTPEQAKEAEETVKVALQQGAILAGHMHGDMARALGEILAPEVDWQTELHEFVMSICGGRELTSWRRPNRRSIDSGVYTPSTYSETVGRIVVAVDTSGSVGGVILGKFLGEVASLTATVTPEMVDLLYWGSAVVAHEKYSPGEYESLIASTKPRGGGGTSPSCITDYLEHHNIRPECVIVLTDGYVGSDWGGAWPCPVLWCIVDNRRVSASTGKTIHIRTK
jgi:predicted metal-dependent peptidase